MPLIHGEWCEHGPYVAGKTNLQSGPLLLGEIAWPDKDDARLASQLRRDVAAPILVQRSHHVVRTGTYASQLLDGRHAVGIDVHHAARHQLLESRHANHEELVEIAADDGLELQPLGELNCCVTRLFENASVELEPGQLAVKKSAWLVVGLLGNHWRLLFARRPWSQGCVLWT